MLTNNLFIYPNWDVYDIGSAIQLSSSEIRKLTLVGEVDVTCQSIPMGSMTIEVLTTEDLKTGKYLIYECEGTAGAAVCLWRIKSIEPIDDKYTRITAEPCIARFDEIEMEEGMVSGSTNMGQIDGVITPYNAFHDNLNFNAYGYLPGQNGRDRLTWLLFVSGQYLSCYGGYKEYSGTNEARSGEYCFQLRTFHSSADLIPYERTFANASFSRRDHVSEIVMTTYDFVRSADMLLDTDDYRFPTPWIAMNTEVSSNSIINGSANEITIGEADANAVSQPEYRKILIDNIYIVTANNAIDIMRRLVEYYMNTLEMTVDVLNAFDYCAGDRVIVYAARDRLVQGIIERATYEVGNYVRSTLKLVCVVDVPGAWLTMNYTVDGVTIGHDRRYLPVGMSYSIKNPTLTRESNGTILRYIPSNQSTRGTMGAQDATVNVTYTEQT